MFGVGLMHPLVCVVLRKYMQAGLAVDIFFRCRGGGSEGRRDRGDWYLVIDHRDLPWPCLIDRSVDEGKDRLNP